VNLRTLELLAGGGLSRREMVAALVRWTVPTVLTITLGARKALAAPSCPPCTKRSGGRCAACTINQILNCQCEPCLGAPYCVGGVRAPTAQPLGSMSNVPGQSGVSGYSGPGTSSQIDPLNALRRQQRLQSDNPFDLNKSPILRSPFSPSPFGASRPYGRFPGDTALRARPRGLYDRLRPDERRPF
jgi:hypothetical protein